VNTLGSGHVRKASVKPAERDPPRDFDAVYDEHFAFVWRNLRRLGVPDGSLRDAAQEVFLVVHRRLGDFEGRAPIRSWLYSIVTRVARQDRRTRSRKELRDVEEPDLVSSGGIAPDVGAERGEALRLVLSLIAELDEDKRTVLILADLEEMTVPEIAEAVEANVNTVYSRLRAARGELRMALSRRRTTQP
jgi:RNA polymerase sigma-70 factor (ECF subfamily)